MSRDRSISKLGKAIFDASKGLADESGDGSIRRRDIVVRTVSASGCSKDSVLPSDYCYNRMNKANESAQYPFLEWVSLGRYRFVGLDFPYNGPVYWKPKRERERVVGRCVKGRFDLDLDPRNL